MMIILPYIGLFGPISLCLAAVCAGILIKRAVKPDVTHERTIS